MFREHEEIFWKKVLRNVFLIWANYLLQKKIIFFFYHTEKLLNSK